MIALDENALICDLAETYQIYDYRSLPVKLVATFSAGLREDSRIKKKIRGTKVSFTEEALARFYDLFHFFVLDLCGIEEEPESLLDYFNGEIQPQKSSGGFDTPEDYEAARKRILEGGS